MANLAKLISGEESRYVTKTSKVHYRLVWTIKDFLDQLEVLSRNDFFHIPKVNILFPKDGSREQDYFSFQLKLYPPINPINPINPNSDNCRISLTTSNKTIRGRMYISIQKTDGETVPLVPSWGERKFFLINQSIMEYVGMSEIKQNKEVFLPDDNLTLVFNFELYSPVRCTTKEEVKLTKSELERDILSDDFGTAFGNEKFSDMDVVCLDRVFKCHKFILAARSDVFGAMFSHEDTAECLNNKIEIMDIDGETLEYFLKYLYTGKADNISSVAPRLLTAADKYNVEALKNKCEEAIFNEIVVENAAEILLLAYLHEAKKLKKVAIDFVKKNIDDVTKTPEWKSYVETQPELLTEILKAPIDTSLSQFVSVCDFCPLKTVYVQPPMPPDDDTSSSEDSFFNVMIMQYHNGLVGPGVAGAEVGAEVTAEAEAMAGAGVEAEAMAGAEFEAGTE